MFTETIKEYEIKRKQIHEEIIQGKKELRTMIEPFTQQLLHSVDSEVAQLHENQYKIDIESKKVKKNIQKLQDHAKNYMKLFDQINESVKQLGDVENWAEIIKSDLQQVTKMVIESTGVLNQESKQSQLTSFNLNLSFLKFYSLIILLSIFKPKLVVRQSNLIFPTLQDKFQIDSIII